MNKASDTYRAHQTAIAGLLAELQRYFDADAALPADTVTWADVGTLRAHRDTLDQLAARVYRRDEYEPDPSDRLDARHAAAVAAAANAAIAAPVPQRVAYLVCSACGTDDCYYVPEHSVTPASEPCGQCGQPVAITYSPAPVQEWKLVVDAEVAIAGILAELA